MAPGQASGRILIVDFGMGNLNSIWKKLVRLDCSPAVSSNPAEIAAADKLILPGVGHFGRAMGNLRELHLLDALNEAVLTRRRPILGICLGMQLMAGHSEEGDASGLGWVDGKVVKIRPKDTLSFKVPHVGWNQIACSKGSALMKDIPELSEFYFVHSYYLKAEVAADILNETEYEEKFTSAIEKNNIFGVQYHPEKSHDVGEILLKNFVDI